MTQATIDLLQAAHDYIETDGFNISEYGTQDEGGPRCWIGVIRGAAGVRPEPYGLDPASDNGPELEKTLRTLDELAEESLAEDKTRSLRYELHRSYGSDIPVGRFIEKLGLVLAREYHWDAEKQERYALALLREALRREYA